MRNAEAEVKRGKLITPTDKTLKIAARLVRLRPYDLEVTKEHAEALDAAIVEAVWELRRLHDFSMTRNKEDAERGRVMNEELRERLGRIAWGKRMKQLPDVAMSWEQVSEQHREFYRCIAEAVAAEVEANRDIILKKHTEAVRLIGNVLIGGGSAYGHDRLVYIGKVLYALDTFHPMHGESWIGWPEKIP